MKEYNCKNGGECEDLASCKRCRLFKCLTVGMNAHGVGTSKFNDEQIMAFAERMKEHPGKSAVLNSPPEQKDLINFILVKNLLQIEEKVRRIRYSETPIPELFYTQSPLLMDLLCVFEIGKTFPFFEQLNNNDKIALCSNIAMPLYVLCSSFYSVEQNCDALCTPDGVLAINIFKNSYYKQDSVFMTMGDKLLRKAVQSFIRIKLSNEEFVLIRAIIYSHMVSPGLSDQAQKLLRSEAEKYSALLMNVVQTNYGPAAGALRYVELMGLIVSIFNTGAKHRQLLSYISNVLDPNFDKVFPPVLAKICTKGPVESHQLFPY
ncbi:hypothetical protein niasHT_033741 [Heterodera trifolii]|uniref:NR LBD domain-containing protein n=1 Tax=Heterodera trifolii TaxID=157864 RepID=A0ABD2I9R5_9BILA